MADHAGFLQAICDNPDDDASRLVYADWLEDNGEPLRARFIRAQCQFAACFPPNDEPFASAVAAEELLPEYRQALLAPLLATGMREVANRRYCGDVSGFAFYLRRGFVEDLEVYGAPAAAGFVEHAEQLFARTPLRHVRFHPDIMNFNEVTMSADTLQALGRIPQLKRLRTLDLSHLGFEQDALLLLRVLRERLGPVFLPGRPVPPPWAPENDPDYDEPNPDDIPF